MEHTIICPLCRTKINYKKINSRYKDPDPTHIWSCPNCPFIGFEYYTNKNTKDLEKYLNKNEPKDETHCHLCGHIEKNHWCTNKFCAEYINVNLV